MTSPLTTEERRVLVESIRDALPWRGAHADALMTERYDAAEQSILLQAQHNDLQMSASANNQQRLDFLTGVMVPLIVKQTLRCLAQPGTPVGIEAATATGRISTQMALNSFHSSGSINVAVQQGVPRLNELFNATRDMKHPIMIIRLLPQPVWTGGGGGGGGSGGTGEEGGGGGSAFHRFKQWTRFLLEHKTLSDFIELDGRPRVLYRPETFPGLPHPEPYWYKHWRAVYGTMRAHTISQHDPQTIWHTIRLKLSPMMLVKYQLSLSYIAQVLQETVLWAKTKKRLGSWTPLIHVIASPDYECTLDIHVRVDHMPPLERIYRKARIQPSRQGQILQTESRRRELFLTQVVMYDLGQVRLCGIPGLHEINWRTRSDPEALQRRALSPTAVLPPHDEWEVITRGSAFKEVIIRPEVHVPSLYTNNPFQVEEVLGIEATRKLYLLEMRSTMGSVDETLFHTIVDTMMARGTVTPANRFGANPMDGPLTRASNEMSTQTLLRAATSRQRENLMGVSAATMVGQPVRIGTGLTTVAWDEELWLDLVAERETELMTRTRKGEVGEVGEVGEAEEVGVEHDTKSSGTMEMTSLFSKLTLVTGRKYAVAEVEEV